MRGSDGRKAFGLAGDYDTVYLHIARVGCLDGLPEQIRKELVAHGTVGVVGAD